MPEQGMDSVFVIGAGAVDRNLPVGIVTPEHEEGGKKDITDIQQYEQDLQKAFTNAAKRARQQDLPLYPAPKDIIETIGGNGLNMARRAQLGSYTVRFCSVYGKDEASHRIRDEVARYGIEDVSPDFPEHVASISYIERLAAQSNRMIRGLPRGDMSRGLGYDHVRPQIVGANIIAVASLKSGALNNEVFAAISSEDTTRTPHDRPFVTFLPGSSEYEKKTPMLRSAMEQRQPNLLAGNETEFNQLHGTQDNSDYEQLAIAATEYAEYAVCTAGLEGLFIARQGSKQVIHAPAIKTGNVVDTTGAGDSVAWTITDGLYRLKQGERLHLQDIADDAAHVGSVVIQHQGAVGDLERHLPQK
jgi:sugar/nucleoside kinase (ribokinase family)